MTTQGSTIEPILRRRERRAQHSLRAESTVRVSDPFSALIRAAHSRDQDGFLKDFDHARDSCTVLQMHNAYLRFTRDRTKNDQGMVECCDILRAVWRRDSFNPDDTKEKWRMMIRNLTEINGQPYTSMAQRATQNQQNARQTDVAPGGVAPLPSAPTSQETGELEPAPINRHRDQQRENALRRNLQRVYTLLDQQLRSLFAGETGLEIAPEEVKSGKRNRWAFGEEDEEPVPAKRAKTDESRDEAGPSTNHSEELSEDERCIICLEARRTHAFLHFGLANQDLSSHFVACESCANTCRWADQGCPCCRRPVVNVIRILK